MGFFTNWWNKITSFDFWPKNYFKMWGISPMYNDYASEVKKLQAVLTNPAMLKVIALQCDLFSLGEIYLYKKKGTSVEKDPLLDFLANPNPMQSQSQMLWDFMFWDMLGTAYCYVDSDNIDRTNNRLYFLDPRKIEFPTSLDKQRDKLIFSESKLNEINRTAIVYRYDDGSTFEFPLSKLTVITDLSNGTGNWWKSASRIDALYKIISNSEAALDSNNINTRFAGKFMVAGTADPNDVTKMPLSETEKQDIEHKTNSEQQVHAVKSMIEIKRFVENMKNMELNQNYLAQYFLIGNMYGIPRDVLEAYQSATYENQEKARMSHISYSLQPKGNSFMAALAKRFGYDSKGWKLVIDWAHLPFMQVFEKDMALVQQTKISTFVNMLKNGVSLDDANKYLDLNLTLDEKRIAEQAGQSQVATN